MENGSASQPDSELIERFKQAPGEARRIAFCALYERHGGAVWGYLWRMSRCPHLADDLTQEAFLRALGGLEGFSGDSSFKTWIYQIATNLLMDHRRRRGPMIDGNQVSADGAADGPGPHEVAEREEEAQRVRQAVEALPDELRAPLLLVRFEGMKYRQAAEVLGITPDALRMRVHRAHLALVSMLTR